MLNNFVHSLKEQLIRKLTAEYQQLTKDRKNRKSDRKMETLQKLEELSLAELFKRMARKEGDDLSYERSYHVFHARYKQRLGNLCMELARKKTAFYQELSLETFRRTLAEVFEQAATFQVTDRNLNTEEEDALVLGWMGMIAQQMLDAIMEERDTFRKVHVLVPGYFEYIIMMDDAAVSSFEVDEKEEALRLLAEKLKADKKKLDVAMVSLSKRDREILLEYFKPKGNRKYLSKERIDYLCRRWNLTEDNMLQIKRRALKKISRILLGNEKKQDKSRRSTDAGP